METRRRIFTQSSDSSPKQFTTIQSKILLERTALDPMKDPECECEVLISISRILLSNNVACTGRNGQVVCIASMCISCVYHVYIICISCFYSVFYEFADNVSCINILISSSSVTLQVTVTNVTKQCSFSIREESVSD